MQKYLFLRTFLLVFSAIPPIAFGNNPATGPDWSVPVDYQKALELARANDPRFALLESRIEAAEGRIEQADNRPNPVIGAEVENFIGSGPFSGVDGVEITLGVRQVIETAGKRERRTALARSQRGALDWQRELLTARIEAEVQEALAAVILARDAVELRGQQVELAREGLEETGRQVEAARTSGVELTRARLALRQQEFAQAQASRELEAARTALASLWGLSPAPDFSVAGRVELEPELPRLEELLAVLPRTAALRRFEAERETRAAALELEQARSSPDLELFGGGRYFNEGDGEAAFVMGVELPWTLFNKNAGNIRSARARLRGVDHEQAAAERDLTVRLSAAWRTLSSAHADVRALEQDLLPAAEQTLAETEAGYQRGQFTLLSVLDSRQALFGIREAWLESMNRYASALAEVRALTRPAGINR